MIEFSKDRQNTLVAYNRTAHDAVAKAYDARHTEIYNPLEQQRLSASITRFCSLAKIDMAPHILDLGAGTGNVTRHLLSAGARVTAADVSTHMLQRLQDVVGETDRLQVVEINGMDLHGFGDAVFDGVAVYSVLHHIPDYLSIVRELVRVLRPGGVIYIDHEVGPSYWKWDRSYFAYLKALSPAAYRTHLHEVADPPLPLRALDLIRKIPRAFSLRAWSAARSRRTTAIERLVDENPEGDIHVYLHDHIEWDSIEALLRIHMDVLEVTDYLVCRELAIAAPLWRQWHDRCSDMRLVIARKK